MPNPTLNQVHVSRPLTNISVAWRQEQSDFVADRVFPIVPVAKQSDQYFVYDRSFWFRSEVQKRAPGTESAGGGYKQTTDNYFAEVYALHRDVADQIRANEDTPLNSDRDATEWLGLQFLINKEKLFASTFLTSGVWTTTVTGVSTGENNTTTVRQWNDPASNPIEDIRRAKLSVKLLTASMPNVLTIGLPVYNVLIDHPDIIDRIKYSGGVGPNNPAMAGPQLLAKLFDVDEVIVSSAVSNDALEGATASNSFVVGKVALLSYRPRTPGVLTPSAGYTFHWTGLLGADAGAAQISKFRMEHLKSDRIEGETAFAQKVVSADMGVYFASIVA